jgi:hypothetical protein
VEQVKKIIKYNKFNRNAMTTDGYSNTERQLAYGITMVNYLGLNLIYDELKTSLGRIPTQDEYIKAYIDKYNYFWEKDGRITYKRKDGSILIIPKIEHLYKHITDRASRTYLSYINEEYIKARIKELYPDYLIYSSIELDTCGVDLLLVHNITKKIELIHVSRDKNLGNKTEIANIRFKPNGNRYKFNRRGFRGHKYIHYGVKIDWNDPLTTLNFTDNGYDLPTDENIQKILGAESGFYNDKMGFFYDFCSLMVSIDPNYYLKCENGSGDLRAIDFINYYHRITGKIA